MNGIHIDIAYENRNTTLPKPLEFRLRQNATLFLKELGRKQYVLSIYVCTSETIRALNRRFRSIDAPTDVLSWRYDSVPELPIPEVAPEGELVFCQPIIQEQAEKSGWRLEEEYMRLLAHGIAHLQGYDHETAEDEAAMIAMEIDLLSRIGLQKLYDP